MGLRPQLIGQLQYLSEYASGPGCEFDREKGGETRCMVYKDWAPHSFKLLMQGRKAPDQPWERIYNGGLVYQGPDCPADGSFPSLTVSFAEGDGWFVHT